MRYIINASVTVDVEMSIEAQTPEAAKAIFDSQIMMTARLTDTDEANYTTTEDSISDVTNLIARTERR